MSKKSVNYWEKRRAQQMVGHLDEAEKAAAEITALYIEASQDLQTRAKKVFTKFQKENHLSVKAAEKLLGEVKDPDNIKQVLNALKKNPKNQDLVRELESQAYASRLRNFAAMQSQLDELLPALATTQEISFRSTLESIAERSFYQTIFDLQQYADAAFSFSLLDPKRVAQVLNTRWAGGNFSSRIWGNTERLAARVKHDLMLNILTGRPLKRISDEISADFATGAFESRRLIRTEANYVSNQMAKEGYKESGADRYIYVAILDLRTSLICRSLDKKTFLVKNAKEGENYPPMHPWCRSTTIPWVPDSLLKKMRQSAIDPVTGERISVPGDMTYEEWYSKYVDGEATSTNQISPPTKQDRALHEKYRALYGDRVPENILDFQIMRYNNIDTWDELKESKQKAINAMSFSEMQDLIGKLGNREVREWYKTQVEKIPSQLNPDLSLYLQARQAHALRHNYKHRARMLMADTEKRKWLDINRPSKSFEELLKYKEARYNITGDELYRDIIRSSSTINKEVNIKVGIE